MKRILLFNINVFVFILFTNSQTFIQGQKVVPFNSITNSNFLKSSDRIDVNYAFAKLQQINFAKYRDSATKMIGEYWFIDGMLVEMIARKIESGVLADDFASDLLAFRPTINQERGAPPQDRTIIDDYYDTLMNVNDFRVLIFYFRTRSTFKNFNIQDIKGRYKIYGTIYTNDHAKGHALIEEILNGLSFR